jgi:hypothetical protein
MEKNFFYMVMEADGDEIEPFDDSAGDDAPADAPPEDTAPPATDDGGSDEPPPLNDEDDGSMDMGMDDSSLGDDSSDDSGGSDDGDDADKKDENLANKANNILNQQLYQKIVNRNAEIEEILVNLKSVVPLLPYSVVKSNDASVTKLKTVLEKGQKYVVNDFIDSGYGENLLFFQKLDSLYTLLLNKIDSNLKEINK